MIFKNKKLLLCVISLISVIFMWDFAYFLTRPVGENINNNQKYLFLHKGENILDLAKKSYQTNYSNHPIYLILLSYLTNKVDHLQAGQYELKKYSSIYYFLDAVYKGKVMIDYFSFIPGQSFSQIEAKLKTTSLIKDDKTKDWLDQKAANKNYEELFLADSYAYSYAKNQLVIFAAAHKKLLTSLEKLRQKYTSLWVNNKTDQDLIIIASLLEKESADYEDKRKIAGVIKNRLEKKMKLQIDASVIYALNQQGKLVSTLSSEDLKIDSAFNTYQNYGLPPSAIAIISLASLEAAFNPEEHNYLYYVAKKDGTHHFSQTYSEHLIAIKNLQ